MDPILFQLPPSFTVNDFKNIEQFLDELPKNSYVYSIEFRHLSWGTEGLWDNCKMILESGLIAIDPRFDKLIVSLRTAVANEMKLDKQQTSFNDLLDPLILALWEYQFKNG